MKRVFVSFPLNYEPEDFFLKVISGITFVEFKFVRYDWVESIFNRCFFLSRSFRLWFWIEFFLFNSNKDQTEQNSSRYCFKLKFRLRTLKNKIKVFKLSVDEIQMYRKVASLYIKEEKQNWLVYLDAKNCWKSGSKSLNVCVMQNDGKRERRTNERTG